MSAVIIVLGCAAAWALGYRYGRRSTLWGAAQVARKCAVSLNDGRVKTEFERGVYETACKLEDAFMDKLDS